MIQRLTDADYRVDAVTGAKALVGAWLCRRLDDGAVVRRRITETEAYCGEEDTAAPRIGIAYASKRDQNRKWRFTLSCRADTPKRLLEKWSAPNRKPCPAGKTFGVIGPNGLYRTCLHALPERSRFERLMNMRKAQR